MIGIRSAFSIRARGHRPHLEAVYMTAPRSVCRNTKKALPTGGRPYMTGWTAPTPASAPVRPTLPTKGGGIRKGFAQPPRTRGEVKRAGLFEIRICRWAEPGAFRLPSPRASFVLAGATKQKHALLAKHVPEPPGRIEPQRPAVKVECDRALHLDVDLVAKLHEVLDRAEMDVGRIVPGRRQVFGPGHMTADQQL